jgi:hypothetical protein
MARVTSMKHGAGCRGVASLRAEARVCSRERLKSEAGARLYKGILPSRCSPQGYVCDPISNWTLNRLG